MFRSLREGLVEYRAHTGKVKIEHRPQLIAESEGATNWTLPHPAQKGKGAASDITSDHLLGQAHPGHLPPAVLTTISPKSIGHSRAMYLVSPGCLALEDITKTEEAIVALRKHVFSKKRFREGH